MPAPLDRLTTARVQDLARRAHDCLGCRDFSRVDVMLSAGGELFVLEVNTIPGLTANSLLPKAARAAGLSMQDVCVRMVEMALARRETAVRDGMNDDEARQPKKKRQQYLLDVKVQTRGPVRAVACAGLRRCCRLWRCSS